MTTYIEYIEDDKGDVVDVLYFDSRGCWVAATGDNPTGGYHPCPESQDVPVYCAHCGELVMSIGLTSDGIAYVLDHLDTWSPAKLADLIEGHGLQKEARAWFYAKFRAESPHIPAAHAFRWAETHVLEMSDALDPNDWDDKPNANGMQIKLSRSGFDIVVTAEPDYDHDWSAGKFTSSHEPGAVMLDEWKEYYRRGGQDCARRPDVYEWYVPSITKDEHKRTLSAMGYARNVADVLAQSYVMRDMRADQAGREAYYIVVTASREGIELGSDSMGGIDSYDDGSAGHWSAVRRNLAQTVTDYDMIDNAIEEAQGALAKLGATA